MPASEVVAVLREIVDDYPEGLRARQLNDLERQTFHVSTAIELAPHGRMVDLGSGVGIFGVGCAVLGMDVTIVDDFRDEVNAVYGNDAFTAHRKHGVKVVERPVIAEVLGWGRETLDLVTTFDSMEHWHASPKRLFHEVMDALRPGGWLILGVPNALNLRKRIEVPLGRAKWSQMADWYEPETFRGHVREPDVADLHYIARDIGLMSYRILGRNWQGLCSAQPRIVQATRLTDRYLRRFPSLCSDIYLIGQKSV